MTPELRPAREEEASALAALEAAATPFPWSEALYRDSLAAHRCLVLDTQHELAGLLVYQRVADTAELLNIAVHPRWQGRGLGKRLMEHFIADNRQRCESLMLEVRAGNESAIRLYRRMGFCRAGLRKNYYTRGESREDALLYRYDCR